MRKIEYFGWDGCCFGVSVLEGLNVQMCESVCVGVRVCVSMYVHESLRV
jgi:hypothetical protein